MIITIQSLLTAAACYGLWVFLRRLRADGGTVAAIVTFGFLIRAVGGQILFWLSFLDLDVGRGLHVGGGFWFFAIDSIDYFRLASDAAEAGPWAILLMPRDLPSVDYLQLLSLFFALFGRVVAAGLLLNLFAYLALVAILLRGVPRSEGRHASIALTSALFFLSFSPASILWSTQPLKDSFFLALVAWFFVALMQWSSYWELEAEVAVANERRLVGILVSLAIATWAIAGIRWYFAFFLWGASPLFYVGVILRTRQSKFVSSAVAVLAFLLTAKMIAISAAPNLNPLADKILNFSIDARQLERAGGEVLSELESRRRGFVSTGGQTLIVSRPLGTNRIATRAISGLSATLFPQFVGESLGIFEIGGSRGFDLLSETDTLFLDCALLSLAWFLFRSRRSLSEPAFWEVFIVGVTVTVFMAYVVTNFGTLIRLREMTLISVCCAMVVIARAEWPGAEGEGRNGEGARGRGAEESGRAGERAKRRNGETG